MDKAKWSCRLRRWLIDEHRKIDDLVKLVDYSRSTVNAWLKVDKPSAPPWEDACKIAVILGIPRGDFRLDTAAQKIVGSQSTPTFKIITDRYDALLASDPVRAPSCLSWATCLVHEWLTITGIPTKVTITPNLVGKVDFAVEGRVFLVEIFLDSESGISYKFSSSLRDMPTARTNYASGCVSDDMIKLILNQTGKLHDRHSKAFTSYPRRGRT